MNIKEQLIALSDKHVRVILGRAFEGELYIDQRGILQTYRELLSDEYENDFTLRTVTKYRSDSLAFGLDHVKSIEFHTDTITGEQYHVITLKFS